MIKTEINNENKARFYGANWGNTVVIDGSRLDLNSIDYDGWLEDSYLELKPLSDIIDEDAIEVAKMLGCTKGNSKDFMIGYGKAYVILMTQDIKTVRVHVPYEVSRVSEYIRTERLLRKFRKATEGIDITVFIKTKVKNKVLKEDMADRIMDMTPEELDVFEKIFDQGIEAFVKKMQEPKSSIKRVLKRVRLPKL